MTSLRGFIKDSILPRLIPGGGAANTLLGKDAGADYDVSWKTLGSRGPLLVTSGAFTAEDSYSQLEHTWSVDGDAPSGINLTNTQLNLPSLPPSGYDGLWAELEIDGTRTDAVKLGWGNTYPNTARQVGEQYVILLISAADDRVAGYDGTTEDSDRSFSLHANNLSPRGIAFYDDKVWVADTSNPNIFAYSRIGTYDGDATFNSGQLSWFGMAAYRDRLLGARSTNLHYFDPSAGTQIGSTHSLGGGIIAARGITALNGYLYLVTNSTTYYYWPINDDFSLGTRATGTIAAGNAEASGITNNGSELLVLDRDDNGYYTYSVNADGSIDASSGTLTTLSSPVDEQGIAIATDPAVNPVDTFTLENDHTKYKRLSSGEEFIDVHYVRGDNGNLRLTLASTTDDLPDDAVVKLYAAMPRAA